MFFQCLEDHSGEDEKTDGDYYTMSLLMSMSVKPIPQFQAKSMFKRVKT